MIHGTRIRTLNAREPVRGRFVLYWMQQSQRTRLNHALEFAIAQGNEMNLPVVVAFGLTGAFPEANLRHYAFMLDGLRDVERELRAMKIRFVLRRGAPDAVALEIGKRAAMIVCDRGYLRIQKQWRDAVARGAACAVVQVESDVVIPVEVASDKEEYAAATIRRKIQRHLDEYLVPFRQTRPKRSSLRMRIDGINLDDALKGMRIDRSIKPVEAFKGGEGEAQGLLDEFIDARLNDYVDRRSDPSLAWTSFISPYLHFGQISPIDIALRVRDAKGKSKASKDAYLEELIVRRELSMNFVQFNPRYDDCACLPNWARNTLRLHAKDKREYLYSDEQLERAQTHDSYWNAAERQMVLAGHMHNTMRMYWGKKIIEWTPSPEYAFKIMLALNNRYELDGRDANSFAGVAWCFGKHDRPWKERDIFGKVRYMNAKGLERKFAVREYVEQIDRLHAEQA